MHDREEADVTDIARYRQRWPPVFVYPISIQLFSSIVRNNELLFKLLLNTLTSYKYNNCPIENRPRMENSAIRNFLWFIIHTIFSGFSLFLSNFHSSSKWNRSSWNNNIYTWSQSKINNKSSIYPNEFYSRNELLVDVNQNSYRTVGQRPLSMEKTPHLNINVHAFVPKQVWWRYHFNIIHDETSFHNVINFAHSNTQHSST